MNWRYIYNLDGNVGYAAMKLTVSRLYGKSDTLRQANSLKHELARMLY